MTKAQSSKYPLLSTIDSPADMRKLDISQLPQVCAEIRAMLIETLSHNPGHFASSMGAVEITVALHYAFDTPYDRIVWDVGHQAYGHKILTGRRDKFDTLRTFGGISGFPNPDESQYDTFSAGHASNSISAALGMAIAARINNDTPRRNVVAVIGDASISGGLAFEGLNNAANTPNNLLIVLNDNDMSIDRNVGALSRYFTHLTTSPGYNALRYKLYRGAVKMGLVSERRRGKILRFHNSLKAMLSSEQNIFEGLNIRYFGPYDGHDAIKLVRIFRDIKDMEGPRILHLRTIKGHGYAPAEANPAIWHAPGLFDPGTGTRNNSCGIKYQDVLGHWLVDVCKDNRSVVAITAAMPSGTSVSMLQHEMPERVFDVGISEEHAVTFAGGLAKEGLRPVVAIYSSFLQRAYDQMIHDVALMHLPVVFAIDRAGIVGEDGVTHHGMYDMAYMSTIPGMVVCAPSDAVMMRDMLHTALHRIEGPTAVRYPRGKAHNADALDSKAPQLLDIGRGRLVRNPACAHVAIVSIGTMLHDAMHAAETLAAQGIEASVYDMMFLKPIDTGILDDIATRSIPVVTVEDGAAVYGGLGSVITSYMADKHPGVRIHPIGVGDTFVPHGTVAQLKALCAIDADGIVDTIKQILEK